MKGKKVKKLVKKKLQHIETYAAKGIAADKEAIHQLRVAYKELRAFIRLARKEAGGEKSLGISPALKDIYQAAGELRNLQVYYDTIAPYYTIDGTYLPAVLQQTEQARHRLSQLVGEFDFGTESASLVKKLPAGISKKTLNKFIEKKAGAITTLLAKRKTTDNGLHSIRKYLKDIEYNLKPFHRDIELYLPIAHIGNAAGFEKCSKVLGIYQDRVTGLRLLGASPADSYLPAGDKNILENIQREWLRDKKSLKQKLFQNYFKLKPA